MNGVASSECTDAQMIEVSLHDSEHFAALYDRHADQLYRYAYRRVGPGVVEDIVADTFVAAFRRRDSYDLTCPDARAWLFGILTREIARHLRREKARYRAMARAFTTAEEEDPALRVVADVAATALRGELAAALARLSAGDRHVLLLIAWGDLTYEETARALDIPIGTVRSRLNRARRRVRYALGNTNPMSTSEERG
ncbi:DNA-directed RNA polymerase sigma-70 factor [Longispora fulva]|uniref:RNA polymerase sigma-70 factor (ECF subfamily) n=2 Tax=Longispora fulva TaxID=619741 RepID=A0A8J7GGN1_9ACTN|nr:RNA polymerase sigma-70 factor (ECF subfamily) [Longispora fulva]GIG62254.1 DNA-directed RNA polymerase sigma-70 factor [Longispora fulva]